jgi:Spy/CpxP family protein refolding chaperone
MRTTSRLIFALAAVATAACSDATSPVPQPLTEQEPIDLLQDFGSSETSVIDAAGVGGAMLPDSLKLTEEQKGKIQALHDAFKAANKADLAALEDIEKRARAARVAGKSREEVQKILNEAKPVLERLAAATRTLHEAIWAVYTPAQQAWIRSRRAQSCEPPRLTEEQIQKIRALKKAFEEAMKDEIALIRKAHAEAEAARKAGKSEEEIKRILNQAKDAVKALREAEKRLHEAIMNVLTPEQRGRMCKDSAPGSNG